MTDEITTWHCPRCGAELQASGSVAVGDDVMPVFQCDTCVVRKPVLGELFDVALTFAVNAAGQPFDPADDSLL